jgi:hypothetical protein
MAEEKKDRTKKQRQTKAGMMGKNSSRTASGKGKAASEKEPENTPKISKEKAENRNDDKPVH